MTKYNERKKFLLGMLEAECSKLENQARFILEKIEGKVVIGKLIIKDSGLNFFLQIFLKYLMVAFF